MHACACEQSALVCFWGCLAWRSSEGRCKEWLIVRMMQGEGKQKWETHINGLGVSCDAPGSVHLPLQYLWTLLWALQRQERHFFLQQSTSARCSFFGNAPLSSTKSVLMPANRGVCSYEVCLFSLMEGLVFGAHLKSRGVMWDRREMSQTLWIHTERLCPCSMTGKQWASC